MDADGRKNALTVHFCPTCGSTVYWEGEGFPGYVAVAIGNFADPNFPGPTIAVWERLTPPLGLLSARHAAQAPGEARVINETAVFCQTAICFVTVRRLMSALGHKRTLKGPSMSALPPKADIEWRSPNVR